VCLSVYKCVLSLKKMAIITISFHEDRIYIDLIADNIYRIQPFKITFFMFKDHDNIVLST